MELVEAVTTRRSIRGYKPDPVSRETILEILNIARWAPSGMNVQPWEFAVVTGAVLDEVIKAVQKEREVNPLSPPDAPPMYKQRRARQVEEVAKSMGGQEAYEKHMKARAAKGARFYGTPAMIFVYNDNDFGTRNNLDIGLLVENILLVAHDKGLGCCVLGIAAAYSDLIGSILKLPDSKKIVTGFAIGYADMSAPENAFPRMREPVESLITWHGI
jgi:nitroreductase